MPWPQQLRHHLSNMPELGRERFEGSITIVAGGCTYATAAHFMVPAADD